MEKNIPVVWTEIALLEYEETIDWLLKSWDTRIAIQFTELVEQKIISLKHNPKMGTFSRYLKDCRKIWIPPYHILIYKISPDSIQIIRFFDGRQSPEKLNQ
jgi:plasmid stabilization system protein ParE